MSYDALEMSIAAGKPLRLYQFSRGPLRWYYTGADRDITYDGRLYKATAISDDGIRQSGEAVTDLLKITAPADNAVAQLFRTFPPSAPIDLTIRQLHYGDAEAIVIWTGSVANVRWPAINRSEIECQSIAATMARNGLRVVWSRACPHALYDTQCKADREAHRATGSIVAIAGNIITVAVAGEQDDGYYTGGFIEWVMETGQPERRDIERHQGVLLTLLGGAFNLEVGQAVSMFPGCPRTIDVCDSRFNNSANYGGIPHLPGKSPFDGSPVF